MKTGRIVAVILVILAVLAGGAGIAYYYWDQGQNYVSTNNAAVAADVVPVSALQNGVLAEWDAHVGDKVAKGDVLGKLRVPVTGGGVPPSPAVPCAVDPSPEACRAAGAGAGAGAAAGSGASGKGAGTPAGAGGGNLPQVLPLPSTVEVDITAPADGTIVQTSAVVGQPVAAGLVLARIADMADAYVVANVPETRIEDVHKGQKVDVTIDAYPGTTFTGRVTEIGLATASSFSLLPSQNTTANFTKVTQVVPVRITLDSHEGKTLTLGQSAEVRIHIK